MKNTGTKVLRLTISGNTKYELESGDEQQIDASSSDYSVVAGDSSTVIATIKYPTASSFLVTKGDQFSGAKFSTTVDMVA